MWEKLAVFIVGWIFCSLIWSIWLDGIYNPIAGLITIGVLFGVTHFSFKK